MRPVLGLLALLPVLLLAACDRQASDGAAAQQAAPPPSVGVAPVARRDVTPAMDFVGRVEAVDSVDLEARVTGFLGERHFAEGSTVRAGDVLFHIEREPFEAALAARQADLARTEAALLNARQQRERMEPLVARGAQPQARLDDAIAAESEARAMRDAAEAAVRQAEIDLSYTEILAPFDGRIGRAAFSEGAVVGPNRGPLARLVRLDPIFVAVPVNDRMMLAIRRTQEANGQFQPFLRLGDGTMLEEPGRFLFFDPQVDQRTDTVTVRAEFQNASELLLPGQFVTVTVRAAEPRSALLIPQIAVQQDQAGHLVLTVDENNLVKQTRVTLGDRADTDWVVLGGLEEGQSVIVEGLQRARPGMTVQPIAATSTATSSGS